MANLPFAKVRLRTRTGQAIDSDSNLLLPTFNPSGVYILAFDQSTSCTGIGIGQKGIGAIAVMELETLMVGNRKAYVAGLYRYVLKMISNLNIHAFMIEDVFEGASPSTYAILRDLRNLLLQYKKLPEVRVDRIERINNFVWKSEFFSEVKDVPNMYTRENSKRLSREVALQKFPWAKDLKEDGYDALGMLDSFCTACYDGDWSLTIPRKINKFIYSEERHNYFYEITTNPLETDIYKNNAGNHQVTTMRYNTDITPRENAYLSTALCKDLIITEEIPQSNWHAIFCLQKGILWNEDTKLYMVAISQYA